MWTKQLESSGSRDAIKTTTTFDAEWIHYPAKGRRATGAGFALQIINEGAEAGGATLTVSYKIITHPAADFDQPYGHANIVTDLACDSAAAGTVETVEFAPKTCWAIQITATYTGGPLTNGQKFYLTVW